jgi:hypothetical protein
MKILSHRGYWNETINKNSKESFVNSFDKHFGTETDLRDYNGEIVISHDVPEQHNLVSFESFLEIYSSYNDKIEAMPLALNIKSDGLQVKVKNILQKYKIENYFFFDMSIPDHIGYIKANLKTYTRQSEYENEPIFYKESNGIWLDAFENQWYDAELINYHLKSLKKVAIVSFDLHKREYLTQWKFLKSKNFHLNENILLCTDNPERAKSFFYEQ